MISNLERYKKDLDALIDLGNTLSIALTIQSVPGEVTKINEEEKKLIADLPIFTDAYQGWYSEARNLVKQLLPDRLDDFARLYEKPKSRKLITVENYRIEDCVHGLRAKPNYDGKRNYGPESAITLFHQQVKIVESIKKRFESSLFDIKQLVQADLFDSELDAAKELLRQKFVRAAGALAGVVLEKHLGQICENHDVKVGKKEPTISELNDALKTAEVLQVPEWRNIQHLGDIRNLCDHNKKAEPTVQQVNDLITGVAKVTKTLF